MSHRNSTWVSKNHCVAVCLPHNRNLFLQTPLLLRNIDFFEIVCSNGIFVNVSFDTECIPAANASILLTVEAMLNFRTHLTFRLIISGAIISKVNSIAGTTMGTLYDPFHADSICFYFQFIQLNGLKIRLQCPSKNLRFWLSGLFFSICKHQIFLIVEANPILVVTFIIYSWSTFSSHALLLFGYPFNLTTQIIQISIFLVND